jgi:hypothetical protein
VGPKMMPPPRHCAARVEPWRARPVPFCFHGLRPPPATSLRPLTLAVPRRAFAKLADQCLVHQWFVDRRSEDGVLSSICPTFSPAMFIIGTNIVTTPASALL